MHGHFAEGGPAAVFLADATKLPLMLHLRGGAELMADEDLQKQLFQRPYLAWREQLWKRASMFVCVSEFIKSKAIKSGFPGSEAARALHRDESKEVHACAFDRRDGSEPRALRRSTCALIRVATYLLRAMAQVQQRQPDDTSYRDRGRHLPARARASRR